MTSLSLRSAVAAICVIAAGLVGIAAAPAGFGQSAMVVIGLVAVMTLVTTAIAFSVGSTLWSAPARGTMSTAARAASAAIDLERLDSDKG